MCVYIKNSPQRLPKRKQLEITRYKCLCKELSTHISFFLFSFFPLTTFPILFENGLRERLHSIFAWLVRFPLCSLFVFTIRGNICTVYRSNPNQIYVSCDVILQSEIPRRGKYLFQWNNNVMFVPFICKQLLISRVCLECFFFHPTCFIP